MEEKKNNIGLVVIVAVLTAVICLSVGFVIGKNILPKEESKTNNNNTVENSTNNDEIVTITKDEYNVVVQEAANKIQIYNEYFGQKYSSTGINATNDEILVFLLANVKKSNFTVDDLKETAKLYFNTNINYTDISIKVPGSNIVLYKLDSNGKYINQNAPTDGPATLAMHSFYEGATYNKTKDSYTLNMKNIYNQVCGGTCGIGYGSFYSDASLSTKVYTNNTEDRMSFADVYDKVKDQLPITSYTFEKNSSGNYVLTSVVIK